MPTTSKRGPYRTPCPRCKKRFTREQFGHRKDGRRNGACPGCRQITCRAAGVQGAKKAADYIPRDERALRLVEQYSGFARGDWRSHDARAWERMRGYTLQELWSHWMRQLAEAEQKTPETEAESNG